MKHKVSKQFGIFRHVKVPFNAATFALAKLVLPKPSKRKAHRTTIAASDGAQIPLFVFAPQQQQGKLPLLMYLHGGAFVFDGAPHHFFAAQTYASQANCVVAFVNYRTAHNHSGATTLQDCFDAYTYLLHNAQKFGANGTICIGGDSAGGYLCLALCHHCKQNGLPLPSAQMLVYPVVDDAMQSPSMQLFSDTPMWDSRRNAKMWKIFGTPPFCPLQEDLSWMPNTYVETAQFDCLRDEGQALKDRLSAHGVAVQWTQQEGTMHGFDICKSDARQQAFAARTQFLRQAFGSNSVDS